jgi:predicted ArsR family transcriptional regulator
MAAASDAGGDGVRRLSDAMVRQGFEPEVRPQGADVEIVLRRCPWASTAVADPDTVCGLHRGIAEGLAESSGIVIDDLIRADPGRGGCQLLVHRPEGVEAP